MNLEVQFLIMKINLEVCPIFTKIGDWSLSLREAKESYLLDRIKVVQTR